MLNPGYIIRKMTAKDVESIMEIEKVSFSLPWSMDSYLGELKNSFANYLVVDCEGEVAGYGGIWVVFEEAHITNIAISPAMREQGLGKALLTALERIAWDKKALRVYLEVRPSNRAALHLYISTGYTQAGVRQGYYSDTNEDALVMNKMLF